MAAGFEHKIDPGRMPRHVAIIMDGNGRWAQQRGLSRIEGHKRGKDSVRAVVEAALPPLAGTGSRIRGVQRRSRPSIQAAILAPTPPAR